MYETPETLFAEIKPVNGSLVSGRLDVLRAEHAVDVRLTGFRPGQVFAIRVENPALYPFKASDYGPLRTPETMSNNSSFVLKLTASATGAYARRIDMKDLMQFEFDGLPVTIRPCDETPDCSGPPIAAGPVTRGGRFAPFGHWTT
jgi:hypothetical protein